MGSMKTNILFGLVLLLSSCVSVKELEKSRDKAISYINDSGFEVNIVMIYNFLQQTNDLPDLNAQSAFDDQISYLRNSKERGDSLEYQMIQRFWKLKDPEFKLSQELLNTAKGIDSLTLMALYCDQFNLDSTNYFPELRKAGKAQDYRTNNALLGLAFIQRNKCFSEKELESINNFLDTQSASLLNQPNLEWNDKSLETAAFRSEANLSYKKAWLKQILKVQQEDGGWKGRTSNESSNSHTTILAIWFLQNVINDLEK